MASSEPTLAALADRVRKLERRDRIRNRVVTITLIVAGLSLLCACLPGFMTWYGLAPRTHVTNLVLHDGLDGPSIRLEGAGIAGITGEYGNLKLWRLARDRTNRTSVTLNPEGVFVELSKNEVPVARWTVTEEGPQFEKFGK